MNSVLHRNKPLIQRLYRDCTNTGNLKLTNELISEDFVGTRGEKGPAGFATTIANLRLGFPDVHFTLEDLVAEGDRVVARWKMQGTHLGPFAGFPATQKPVTQTAMVIYQIRESRLVRAWLQPDSLGLLQQIGIIPPLAVQPPKAA